MADRFKIYAMDLIGFGRSARKPAPPYFDIELWLRQIKAMIGRIEGDKIGLVGHSISGAMSLMTAAGEPRVTKVLTTGTMGARVPASDGTVKTWSFPKNRAELQAAAEVLIYDKSVIDEAYLANREAVLFAGDYEPYFTSMFAGDKQAFIDAAVIPEEVLKKITCDVTMLHGRNDLAFPPEATLTLAKSLPQANVVLIGRCSHSVAFEHPDMLLAAAATLFPAKA
jgi:2-hydroxymuconate-semialdehyde hydrolase